MREIVKVQLPLSSSDPSLALPLVYAKGGKRMAQQPLNHATKVLMGNDVKAFFQAEYQPSLHRWLIGARVKDRSW